MIKKYACTAVLLAISAGFMGNAQAFTKCSITTLNIFAITNNGLAPAVLPKKLPFEVNIGQDKLFYPLRDKKKPNGDCIMKADNTIKCTSSALYGFGSGSILANIDSSTGNFSNSNDKGSEIEGNCQ